MIFEYSYIGGTVNQSKRKWMLQKSKIPGSMKPMNNTSCEEPEVASKLERRS